MIKEIADIVNKVFDHKMSRKVANEKLIKLMNTKQNDKELFNHSFSSCSNERADKLERGLRELAEFCGFEVFKRP